MNQTVTISKEELLAAIQRDCVSFFAFYLQDELTLEVPQFHIEIWDELLEILDKVNHPEFIVGHLQKLFAVPREHSKSTLAKLAVVLFMRYSRLAFTLYASKTAGIATNAIKDIISWFESDQEAALYGPPTKIQANEQKGLWIYLIGIPGQVMQKRIIIKALGADQQVRGTLIDNKRPQFVVIDDIEDLDTADGGNQQKKLDEWFMGSLLKATARCSVRIFIGNMVRSTTLLARLAKDSDWNPTVFGALVRDKQTGLLRALWEGRWSVATLLEDYRKYRKIGMGYVWETEMMNLSGDKLLQQSLDAAVMIPDINPEEVECGFICLDPAFGLKSWHDQSAITVHVRVRGIGIPILAAHRVGRWPENLLFDQLIELSYFWNLTTWAIESTAAQKLLIPYFRLLMIERQLPPEIFSILPVQAGMTGKSSRIMTFRQSIANRSYGLTESQIDVKLKLEEYSPEQSETDDLQDSAAYGPVVWNSYGTIIESQGIQSIAGRLMQVGDSGSTGNIGEVNVVPF